MNPSPKGLPVSPNINIEQALNLSRGSSSLSSSPTQNIEIPNKISNIPNTSSTKASSFSVGSPSSLWNIISGKNSRGRDRATSFSASDSASTFARLDIQEKNNENGSSSASSFPTYHQDNKRSASISGDDHLRPLWKKAFINSNESDNYAMDDDDDLANFRKTSQSNLSSRRKSTLAASLAGSGMVAAFGNHYNN